MDFEEISKIDAHKEPYVSIINKEIENMINSMQNDGHGYLHEKDQLEYFNSYPRQGLLLLNALTKMRAFGLIIDKDHGAIQLSPKGLDFTTFKNEGRRRWRNANPRTHDLVVVIIGAALSLLVGCILWQLDSRIEDLKYKELNNRIQEVNLRLDSLTKLPIFQDDYVVPQNKDTTNE
jgi:hypothetical protein